MSEGLRKDWSSLETGLRRGFSRGYLFQIQSLQRVSRVQRQRPHCRSAICFRSLPLFGASRGEDFVLQGFPGVTVYHGSWVGRSARVRIAFTKHIRHASAFVRSWQRRGAVAQDPSRTREVSAPFRLPHLAFLRDNLSISASELQSFSSGLVARRTQRPAEWQVE